VVLSSPMYIQNIYSTLSVFFESSMKGQGSEVIFSFATSPGSPGLRVGDLIKEFVHLLEGKDTVAKLDSRF
jgi:hypothetical protein